MLAGIVLLTAASAVDCPFTGSKAVAYCNVEITPEERFYGGEMTINITVGFMREYEPYEKLVDVEIDYYNKKRNLTVVEFKTDENGIAKFRPEIGGYHLVKACGKSILIYVNTTCGDGYCGGNEGRLKCPKDCGNCGDGICDSDESLECMDCSVCGDHVCSAGETRNNCLKDCMFCGDGICDYMEDRKGCPDDCNSGEVDGVCDREEDEICDPDCSGHKEDIDCAPVQVASNDTYAPPPVVSEDWDTTSVAVVLIALIIATSVTLWRLRKPIEPEEAGGKKSAGGKGAKTAAAKKTAGAKRANAGAKPAAKKAPRARKAAAPAGAQPAPEEPQSIPAGYTGPVYVENPAPAPEPSYVRPKPDEPSESLGQ